MTTTTTDIEQYNAIHTDLLNCSLLFFEVLIEYEDLAFRNLGVVHVDTIMQDCRYSKKHRTY